MAHGKETPRQKMIGMMYLVLTALLALNVSAEVLNAFVLIDESLRKSYTNIDEKNETIYANFAAKFQENKEKVRPWKDRADIVEREAQQLFNKIDSFKNTIVRIVEGEDAEYFQHEDDLEKVHHIQEKKENNVPGQVMILEGGGTELKNSIDGFSDLLADMIKESAPVRDAEGNPDKRYNSVIEGIRSTLRTDSIEGEDGMKDWEHGNFDQLPMAAVLAMLSKMQTDVRNAEADMLNYLYAQIEAGAFKFNKLEAIVKPTKGSYILQGNTYEAEIFIAASDTTMQPKIFVNGNELKEVTETGKGIYRAQASSVGPKTISGRIDYKGPEGIIPYEFKASYEVGAPSLTVSPTKMNVFYIGVDNPVSISVSGVPENKIFPTASGGFGEKIRRKGSEWIVNVSEPTPRNKYVYIGASAEIDGERQNMGRLPFRVKRVPDPVAVVGGQEGGPMSKALFLQQTGVAAKMKNFDFDLPVKVTKFMLSAAIGGYQEMAESNGAYFSNQQKQILQKVRRGNRIYLDDIEIVVAGERRNIGSLSFKLD